MFSGIIQCIGKIINIITKKNIITIFVQTPKDFTLDLKIGDSISNNGCCLTIINIINNIIIFNIIKHTLSITTFKNIKIGELLNLEKPLKINEYIGSHIILGHITNIALITKIVNYTNYITLWMKPYHIKYMKFIIEKGSICIDGIGLTIDKVLSNQFSVNIIPITLYKTTLRTKHVNHNVNIEIDIYTKIIVNKIEKISKYFNIN
ncbi:riboflavin synthase [Enterobacteriaceae endosymbiont of Neohaemonia nigricornis]|uniref:riboflavin synthase n=1 Tax=Enterobacteriaceae endosymbiont of Neohaemonia nigricornis TaxID=2675792 RepID=UPI001449D42C|nr:riboflavin synthase [Enterobacteriaceae endosymbiont of Neohaemonia nigricornis]QJC30311.1 riboflavin synthase [Enterobacteriaceae endosymbiont of Neohaemonia nigricornis]